MGVPVDKFKEEVFATDMKEQLPTAWRSATGFDFNNFKDLLELVFADEAGKDEICQKGVDSHGVHFTFTPMVRSTTFVTIWDLPVEIPNEEIRAVMAEYGDVQLLKHAEHGFAGKSFKQRKRLMRIKMKTNLPKFLSVGGHRARIQYTGLQEAEKARKFQVTQAVNQAVEKKLVSDHDNTCLRKSMHNKDGGLVLSHWHPEVKILDPEPDQPLHVGVKIEFTNAAKAVKKQMDDSGPAYDNMIYFLPEGELMSNLQDDEELEYVPVPVTPPVLAAIVENGDLELQIHDCFSKDEKMELRLSSFVLEFGHPDNIDLVELDQQIKLRDEKELYDAQYNKTIVAQWRKGNYGNKFDNGYDIAMNDFHVWCEENDRAYIKLDNPEKKLLRIENAKKKRLLEKAARTPGFVEFSSDAFQKEDFTIQTDSTDTATLSWADITNNGKSTAPSS